MLEAADRQREMAEQAGRVGRVPDEDEYRLATARVAELQAILNRSVAPVSVPDDPSINELGDVVNSGLHRLARMAAGTRRGSPTDEVSGKCR